MNYDKCDCYVYLKCTNKFSSFKKKKEVKATEQGKKSEGQGHTVDKVPVI